MTAPTRFATSWRKSTHSGNDSNCVEVAFGADVVGVRDSKHPDAGRVEVDPATFRSFVDHIKTG